MELTIGMKYFWAPGVFPHEIIDIDEKYVTTKATYPKNVAPRRIYREVLETAIANGTAEIIKEV